MKKCQDYFRREHLLAASVEVSARVAVRVGWPKVWRYWWMKSSRINRCVNGAEHTDPVTISVCQSPVGNELGVEAGLSMHLDMGDQKSWT